MTGFYLMHRGWQDNPAFGNEPFSRRDAWVWMIERAAYADRKIDVAGKTVELKRGQFCDSYRYMAEAWRWSVPAVQRFLTRLKTDTMIDTASDTGRIIVTICNYDKYQPSSLPPDTAPDTAPDTSAIHERYKEETREIKDSGEEEERARAVAQGMVEVWHEAGLPEVRKLTTDRVRSLVLRWRSEFARDPAQWRAYCQAIRGSPFLMGDNESGWRADIDFALRPKSINRVLEGYYRGQRNQNIGSGSGRAGSRRAGAHDALLAGFAQAVNRNADAVER